MFTRSLTLAIAIGHLSSALAADVTFYDEGPLAGRGYPFSESVRVGDLLFLAGTVGTDESDRLVPGGIAAEARQTMLNIQDALQRRGLAMSDIVKCTIFLADIAEWAEFNKAYTRFFEPPYPARSAFGTSGLALDARVEVECIAAYP